MLPHFFCDYTITIDSLSEFVDESRPYICLLDDNVLACPKWREVFDELAKYKYGAHETLKDFFD